MGDLATQAQGIVDAFNDSDWDAASSLLGDSTYVEYGTHRTLSGSGEIVEALKGWKSAMPDVRGTVTSTTESGGRVVLEVSWEGTQTGEMMTEQGPFPPSGKQQQTPSAFIFDFENGKLKESRNYFDLLGFLKQIGAA